MKNACKTTVAMLLVLLAGSASAATATNTFNVTASITATCSVSTSSVGFGMYNPASTSTNDASGAVAVTCTNSTTYTIALDAGSNAGGATAFSNRRMKANTSDYLGYQLYLDSGYATVWGDGTNTSSVNPASGTFTGTGSQQSHTVYGRITAGNYSAPGSYSDTVTVTVTYN